MFNYIALVTGIILEEGRGRGGIWIGESGRCADFADFDCVSCGEKRCHEKSTNSEGVFDEHFIEREYDHVCTDGRYKSEDYISADVALFAFSCAGRKWEENGEMGTGVVDPRSARLSSHSSHFVTGIPLEVLGHTPNTGQDTSGSLSAMSKHPRTRESAINHHSTTTSLSTTHNSSTDELPHASPRKS